MTELTKVETRIFELLKAAAPEQLPMDAIVEDLGTISRHSLFVRIRYLSSKVATQGYIIEKNAAVGRGNKSSFRLTKRF